MNEEAVAKKKRNLPFIWFLQVPSASSRAGFAAAPTDGSILLMG